MKLVKLKTIALFFACVFFLTYLPACAPQGNIKVGVLGTMSGINSDLSVSGRRGVEMAVEEINQKGGIGGRMVELVIKDDQNDPAIAQKAYEEFVAEKIPAVIGPYTSGMIVGSIEYIRKQDILLLGPTISADVLSNTDDNFIRFIASTQEQAVALTNIAKKNNDKNFAVIYDSENKGFNEALFNNFKALLKKNNGKVVLTATFSSQENTGFSALANQIVASGADGVFIIANSACNAELSQQIRKTSSQIHIYSPCGPIHPN